MSTRKDPSASLLDSFTSWWNNSGPSSDSSKSKKNSPKPATQHSTAPVNPPSPVVEESAQAKRTRLAKEKLEKFESIITAPKVNLKELQDLCTRGIPDKVGLRQTCWMILLNVLPLNTSLWASTITQNRDLWNGFMQELIVNPRESYKTSHSAAMSGSANDAAPEKCDDPLSSPDHPLSQDKKSTWAAYFKDCELQAEIKKDVNRTFPTLHFFRQGRDEHLESLERILFIWCKLNPGVSYVQGMNEVLGPLYYLFAIDPSINSVRSHVETNAFFCFTNLMSEIMNNFIKTLDKSEVGIVNQIHQLSLMLQEKDPQLWKDLENKKLNLQFFAFRQLTLLLSQEFELPEVLRLWDTLFSDANRFEMLKYTCCAMLMLQREALLTGDFAHNLKLMQSYPPSDIEEIISYALDLANNPEFEPPFLDLDELKKSMPSDTQSEETY